MLAASSQDRDVAVVAHFSVPVDSLDRQSLLELYSLEENKWSDGSLVVLVDQKAKSDSKHIFYKYLGREHREMKKIWMRMILSGEGRTPMTARSMEDVIRKVSETPGAIGYVEASLVTDEVKVLSLINDEADPERPGS